MSYQYSSEVYWFFALGNSFYGLLMLMSFLVAVFATSTTPPMSLLLSAIGLVFGFFAYFCQWLIWMTKPSVDSPSSNWGTSRLLPILVYLQAIYPVLISAAAALRLAAMLFRGPCAHGYTDPLYLMCNKYYENGGVPLAVLIELIFNPMLTFSLLRDTPVAAIWISWMINLIILITYTVTLRSFDVTFATVFYVYATVILFWDAHRRYVRTTVLVTRLQTLFAENTILVADAKAAELRAMISNLAHDLKSPLTSFLSGVECMLDVVVSWEALLLVTDSHHRFLANALGNLSAIKTCLNGMNGTNSFMTMTINRCLDYSKICNGIMLVPNYGKIALQRVLDTPLQMMRDAQSKIELRMLPLPEGICTHIITDKQWLLENLLCLLSNAVKYSTSGHVDCTVTLIDNPCTVLPDTPDVDRAEQHLSFEVQDMGIGLSDEAMAQLFVPFEQAQRLTGGAGLGLFTLARRVEALQGQCGVRRRPDSMHGSLFWFTIPYRADAAGAEVSMAEEREEADNAPKSAMPLEPLSDILVPAVGLGTISAVLTAVPQLPPPPVSYSVLVVDDAPLIVRMITMLLKRKGHTVEQAVNGAEALDRIVAAYAEDGTKPYDDSGTPAFDVVVMDLQMPVMDGIEAIRRVRAAEQDAGKKEQGCLTAFVVDRDQSRQEEKGKENEKGKDGGAEEGEGDATLYTQQRADGVPMKDAAYFTTDYTDLCSSAVASNRRDGGKNTKESAKPAKKPTAGPQQPQQPQQTKNSLRQRHHQFIIAVSANSDHQTVQDVLSAGADAFIPKPFSYDSFQEAIERKMQ